MMKNEAQTQIRRVITSSQFTPKGLIYIDEWGPLRHACNQAFLALVTVKLDPEGSDDLLTFAKNQVYYILGDSGRRDGYEIILFFLYIYVFHKTSEN